MNHPLDFSDWSEVAKGGENGLSLLLVCIPWFDQLAWYREEFATLNQLVADLNWALTHIVEVQRSLREIACRKRASPVSDAEEPSKKSRID